MKEITALNLMTFPPPEEYLVETKWTIYPAAGFYCERATDPANQHRDAVNDFVSFLV